MRDYYAFLTLLFLISPVTAAILSFILLFYHASNEKKVNSSIFFLALFLGLLNSLKVPENDLKMYLEHYNYAELKGLLEYLLYFGKEPFYYSLNYFFYKISFGSFTLYVIFFSVVSYYLIFKSIWKIHNKLKGSKYALLVTIAVAFLFPMLFSLSAHIMRQFLASSFIIYILTCKIFYNENKYLFFLLAVLTHTTSLIFIIIFLPLNKKVKLIRVLLFSVLFVSFILSLFIYANELYLIFESTPVLSYLFLRLSNTDQYFQTDNLGFVNYALQLFIVAAFYIQSISKKFIHIEYERYKLFFISLLLFLFIISNYYNTEIALRFSFYMYFFFPLAFYFFGLFFGRRVEKAVSQISFIPIILIFLFWFIFKLTNGSWTYNNLDALFIFFNYEF